MNEIINNSEKTVAIHVKSFMTALGLHAAVNTSGISENREAFLDAERRVESVVRKAFSEPSVVEALTAYDDLILRTRMSQPSSQAGSLSSPVAITDSIGIDDIGR